MSKGNRKWGNACFSTKHTVYVNSELPWGLDPMPVSIVDDEVGIFDTADPWSHIPQEVHLTLPHLNCQEIHLHTIEEIQLSSNMTLCVFGRVISSYYFPRRLCFWLKWTCSAVWTSDWSLKKSRQFHTHIFGRSEVEEHVISSNRLHMEDDGVIAAFLDLWPVGADTVSTGRHRHLNLGVKGHERSSQRVQTTHDEWSYFSSCSL